MSEGELLTHRNPNDPLNGLGPEAEKVLFEKLTRQCSGHDLNQAMHAAINLLVNVIRQSNPRRKRALDNVDEVAAKMKSILDMHYDPVTGARRNVFPFSQVLELDHFRDRPSPAGG